MHTLTISLSCKPKRQAFVCVIYDIFTASFQISHSILSSTHKVSLLFLGFFFAYLPLEFAESLGSFTRIRGECIDAFVIIFDG